MECHEKELYFDGDGLESHTRYFELRITGEERLRSFMGFLEKLKLSFARKVFEWRDREGKLYDDPLTVDPLWDHLVQQFLCNFPVTWYFFDDVGRRPTIILGWHIEEGDDVRGNRVLLQKLKDRMEDALRFV